jgi:MFS family permease
VKAFSVRSIIAQAMPLAFWRRTTQGLSRDALLLCLSTLLAGIPIGALQIDLPIYLKRIHYDAVGIGLLYTVSGLVSATLLFLFGVLADRFSRKLFLVLGTLTPAFSYVLFLTSTDARVLTVASAIGGVGLSGGLGGALATSAFNALLAALTHAEHRTRAFSVNEAGWALSLMLGSLVAGLPALLRARLGFDMPSAYHAVFMVAFGLILAATVVLLPVREPGVRRRLGAEGATAGQMSAVELSGGARREPVTAAQPRYWVPRRSTRTIFFLALVLGALGLGLGFVTQLLPLWFFLRFHADEAALGPWYALAEALAVVGTLLAPRIARWLGSVGSVVALQGSSAALLLAMAVAPLFPVAALLLVGRQMAMNSSWPIQQAYAMTVVEPNERATASSVAYGTWGLASSVTPALGGYWLHANNFVLPFIAGTACYGLSVCLFWAFFHRRERASRQMGAAADYPV